MNTKQCTKCLEEKNTREFAKSKRAKDGLQHHCRSCQRIYRSGRNSTLAEYMYHIQKTYRISRHDYIRLWLEQDGKCAICGRESQLCVDHDHDTNTVRGLLCHRCNIAVGVAESGNLTKVLNYIEKHREKHR